VFALIRNWLDRRVIARSQITPQQWAEAYKSLPLLRGLSEHEKQTLQQLVMIFLHRKVFEGAHGLAITEDMKLIIAMQACLPILYLGLDCYDNWYSVIVYPAGFAPKRVVTDEYGVEHQEQTGLSGESWQRGPVILSWDDAEHAGVIDGHNLVIHEFAHKLDMQNGVANGFPPLHANMHRQEWVEALSAGFADFQRHCAHGRHSEIDCYGATSPAEFFAVLSEVFFERPGLLLHHYPDIYTQFTLYYRQDPLLRLS
jgi:Mlc titration factor MtfA (ptsG expression regulator)